MLSLNPENFSIGTVFCTPGALYWLLATGGNASNIAALTCNCHALVTRNGSALTSYRNHCHVQQWPLPGSGSVQPVEPLQSLTITFGHSPAGIQPGDLIQTDPTPYSTECYEVTAVDALTTPGLQTVTALYKPLQPPRRF